MAASIIPFHCYPQFRSADVESRRVDLAWREATVLRNRISISVMPLLNDELVFDSFSRHDALWNSQGCRIFVRGNYANLAELADEHHRLYAHLDNSEGDLKRKLERAEYLETHHAKRFVPFAGGAAQNLYRDALAAQIKPLILAMPASSREAARECLAEIERYELILDLGAALKIMNRNDMDESFRSVAHFAYFHVGAMQFGSSPLIPRQHVCALPEPYRTDIIAEMLAAAQRMALEIQYVPPDLLADLPLADVISLSESYVAADFSRKLRAIVDESMTSEKPVPELAAQLLERLVDERDREIQLKDILENRRLAFSMLGIASPVLAFLGRISFAVALTNRFYKNLRMTPMLTYADKIRRAGETDQSKKIAANLPPL